MHMKEGHGQRKFVGMLIPAFILIGIGVGLLFGRPDVGALAGLGTGFIAMGIAKIVNSPENRQIFSPGPFLVPGPHWYPFYHCRIWSGILPDVDMALLSGHLL